MKFSKIIYLLLAVMLFAILTSCSKSTDISPSTALTTLDTNPSQSEDTPTMAETLIQDNDTDKTPIKTEVDDGIPKNWKNLIKNRESFRLGVNKNLSRRIKVHLFFIDDNESSWTEDEISAYMKKQINPGLDFLEKQASNYGVSLSFTTAKYATVFEDGYVLKYDGVVSDRYFTADIMDKIAPQLGYYSKDDMHYDLNEKNSFGEVILMAVLDKDGISYTNQQVAAAPDGTSILEFCILFTSYLDKNFGIDDNTQMAASLAHEILHLYGAEDIYVDDYVETARKVCPKDIMLLDYLFIDQMEVSEYTAYRVGWLSKSPY